MPTDVGVLALQGDFARHIAAIERAGGSAREVRKVTDLDGLTHLVLPGGESTTLLRFMAAEGFEEALTSFHASGRPLLATCAGLILLAREVTKPAQRSYGLLDVVVERNGYGRQLSSFIAPVDIPALGTASFEAVFIRAPIIRGVGDGVEVLARHDELPVLVRQGNILAASFHPELSDDPRLAKAFLALQEEAY